jgi:hypothetical protein
MMNKFGLLSMLLLSSLLIPLLSLAAIPQALAASSVSCTDADGNDVLDIAPIPFNTQVTCTAQADNPDVVQVTMQVEDANGNLRLDQTHAGNTITGTFTADVSGLWQVSVLFFDSNGVQTGIEIINRKVSFQVSPLVIILNGWMTGGGVVRTDDHDVTHGFRLECDASEKPNNLQVNWDRGNKFHLESLTSASCTDDPTISPNPPDANFDTYTGTGDGRYNGESGATAEWRFTDAGEPGSDDTMTITIRDSNGNIVLSITNEELDGGNHQAHSHKA